MRRELIALIALIAANAAPAGAQERLLARQPLDAGRGAKIFDPAGLVRIVGWDKDTIEVRGKTASGERFFIAGDHLGVKLGIQERADDRAAKPCTLTVYLPRTSAVAVKSVSASITGADVGGWFYTVSGRIQLGGSGMNVRAFAMGGDIDIAMTVATVHAETGEGRITLRGAPQDVDLSSVSGALDVAAATIAAGRFASITGMITFSGAPASGGVLDFTDHGGDVTLLLPDAAAGTFSLSTIQGTIENGMSLVKPAAERAGAGSSLRLVLGDRNDGGRVTVRTFKGAIRLRPLRGP